MKRLMFVLAMAAALAAANQAKADSFQMGISSASSDPTALGRVIFDGSGDFSFGTYNSTTKTLSASGNSFGVGSVSDPSGAQDALALQGYMTGTFKIGTIFPDSSGGEFASVTTSSGAQFVINDGSGHNLTADLTFSSIQTDGTSTTLNETTGTVNLTNFVYSGSNQNLQDLTSHLDGGNLTINFTFVQQIPLDQLDTTATSTTFSGTLVAAPAPASCVLMLTGGLLSGLGFLRRRIFRLA